MHNLSRGPDHLPALGLGTWELRGRTCRRAVRHALHIGYRHIDTAAMYQNELEVGQGIRESGIPRQDLFLTTKLGMTQLRRADAISSAEASLRQLAADYVDLLLIHWPRREAPLGETLEALMSMVEAGKARHIGVSNFPSALLREAASLAPIACNQVEYHPFLSQRTLLATARELEIAVVAYSPLAVGRVVRDKTLRVIGKRYGKSAAQIALRWLLQQDGVGALTRSRRRSRRKAALAVLDFELSDQDMTAVSALARGERFFEPDWFAYRWDED